MIYADNNTTEDIFMYNVYSTVWDRRRFPKVTLKTGSSTVFHLHEFVVGVSLQGTLATSYHLSIISGKIGGSAICKPCMLRASG